MHDLCQLRQESCHLTTTAILTSNFVKPLAQNPFSSTKITESNQRFRMITRKFKSLVDTGNSTFRQTE